MVRRSVKRTGPPRYPEHPLSEHKWRIDRARRIMKEENLDALMLARNVNVFYTTGTRFVFVLNPQPPAPPRPQSTAIITLNDVIYTGRFGPFDSDAVGLDTSLVDTFEYVDNEAEIVDVLKKYGVKRGDRIGTEWGPGAPSLGINPFTFEALRKRVTDEIGAQFVDGTTAIWKMRAIKSKLEIERMKKAVTAAAKAMDRVLGYVEIGMNELDVARRISMYMLEEGADAPGHNQVNTIGQGPVLSSCAAVDRRIEKGYVSLDIGALYKHYKSDINRGVMLGRQPTPDERKLYDCRAGVNGVFEKAIKPGVSMDEVLEKANKYVHECGCEMQKSYGGLYGGHGQGLESHEKFSIRPSSLQPEFQNKEGKVLFEEGMIFTFETPIALPGSDVRFNVEDDVVVTATGCENMNSMLSRELRVKL